MQLLYSPASPFARKVRVAAAELGLTSRIECVEVSTKPVAAAPEVARANPLGKIPTLLRDDGPALYDSRVICRYLDHLADGSLYPQGRIWEVLTLEALADGLMDAAILIIYERRFREEAQQDEAWLKGQTDKIYRSLDALSEVWLSHLQGPSNAAQIATACALSYLDFRHDALGWRDGHASLAAWHESYAERPAMRETAPA